MRIGKIYIVIVIIFCLSLTWFYMNKCLEIASINKLNRVEEESYTKSLFMDKYSCTMNITFMSNKTTNKYKLEYIYNRGYERLTYIEPEKFNGMCIETGNTELVHTNPYIQKNLKYHGSKNKTYNNILYSSFCKNYILDVNSKMYESENKSEIILKCVIPGDNYYFKYQEVILDIDTKLPKKMIIYNRDNVKAIMIDYLKISDYTDK